MRVLKLKPFLRPRRKCPDLLSRFRGSMLGSLVGDCLGSPFEGEERPIAKSVINPYFEKLNEPTQSRKGAVLFCDRPSVHQQQ